jgi:hypothetical protein
MKTWLRGWLMVAGCACASLAAAAPPNRTAHLDDTAHVLPPIPGDLDMLEGRLAEFERTSGIKILVEFHEHAPTPEQDKVPGAYMRLLSGRLGVRQHGVLVVYFAEDSDWRVWIGDDLTARFVGKPGTVKQLTASGAIHDVKEAMLTAARAKADAAMAALQKSLAGDELPSGAERARIQLDAMLEALMAKFGAK